VPKEQPPPETLRQKDRSEITTLERNALHSPKG
jgi:hypothetical protein